MARVAFYADSNNDGVLRPATDALLGYAAYDATSGLWKLTVSTIGWAPGNYRLFSVARDRRRRWGEPLEVALQVA
ncbi:MAG: hypothetical protein U0797_17440 [Gemmataceae bacterium]